MIRFPYGISDFHRIRSDNYLYLDRTAMLHELEEAGRQLVFLRPRRFGKSLLLSTLANYYDIFNNRDYRWSHELTVKTAFLTLLFNDLFYIMDSESALERGYSDLVMIIRPSARQYPTLKDFVFEFNYLKLDDLKLSEESVRSQSRKTPQQLPQVNEALREASRQLTRYQQVLAEKYQEPERLRCFAVIALGFERLVWQQL